MNRAIMIAVALLALTSGADARHMHHQAAAIAKECNVTMPCDFGNNFLAGVVSIKVTMHRVSRAVPAYGAPSPSLSYTGGGLVSSARAYLGQTAAQIGLRRSLWCSAFVRHITRAVGVDDRAISWAGKTRVAMAPGTIAVMRHHVGIVSGIDGSGNPIIISGNNGGRVREAAYPRGRVLAFVSAQ
jgi:hypothetical protein